MNSFFLALSAPPEFVSSVFIETETKTEHLLLHTQPGLEMLNLQPVQETMTVQETLKANPLSTIIVDISLMASQGD